MPGHQLTLRGIRIPLARQHSVEHENSCQGLTHSSLVESRGQSSFEAPGKVSG